MPLMSIHNENIERDSGATESLEQILQTIDEFRSEVAKRDPNQTFRVWLTFNEHCVEYDLFPM